MNKKFAIGIPTVNRADLLNPALERYVREMPNTRIFIIDNGGQNIFEHKNIVIRRPGRNLGVAASWNRLCDETYSESIEQALILNDDIELGRTEEQIINLIEHYKEADFLFSTSGWCAFLIPYKTFYRIGRFDEQYKNGYYEDNDYAYRMILKDAIQLNTMVLYPDVYRESMSKKWEPALDKFHDENKTRFITKWGGMPTQETYRMPFNNPERALVKTRAEVMQTDYAGMPEAFRKKLITEIFTEIVENNNYQNSISFEVFAKQHDHEIKDAVCKWFGYENKPGSNDLVFKYCT